MIRIHIDPQLRSIVDLIEYGIRSYLTHRMHPLAPAWRSNIVRMGELRRPMPPRRAR